MPELPEVECLTRAVRHIVKGCVLEHVKFYRKDLRSPIPIKEIKQIMLHEPILLVKRRSKYMLLKTSKGYGIIHLGMTGNIICADQAKPLAKHTHAVFTFRDQKQELVWLHYIDPRRFGRIDCLLGHDLKSHKYFSDLGPEPLVIKDLTKHLFQKSRNKKKPIKNFIMDASVVVGVGNIYASESLFKAKIHPEAIAGTISERKYQKLADEIQSTLKSAVKAGGTTLRDFKNADGNPGYFAISLAVYNRAGSPCLKCKTTIESVRQSGRTSFYCPSCQKLKQ